MEATLSVEAIPKQNIDNLIKAPAAGAGRNNMKRIIMFGVVVIALCLAGCSLSKVISGNIVKPADPVPTENQLTYHTGNFSTAVNAIKDISNDDDSARKKISTIKKIYSETVKAGKIDKVIALSGNMGVKGARQELEKQIDEGFQYGMNAVSIALTMFGISVPVGGGLLARQKKRINYEVKKNRIKTSVINGDPVIKAKVEEAAKHTIAEGNII